MIREIVATYTDPLAGSYLWGWTLLVVGGFLGAAAPVLLGAVLIVGVLLIGGALAYAE